MAALKRRASKYMQKIMLTVNGGKVTLKGLVGSWAEWHRVSNLVWNTPGVTDVRDNICVAN